MPDRSSNQNVPPIQVPGPDDLGSTPPPLGPREGLPAASASSPSTIAWRRLGPLTMHWRRWRIVILLGLFILPNTRELALAVWSILNGWLVLRATPWSLLHPSRVWRERGTILRWAVWPALLATLLLRSTLEPVLAEVTGQWLPSSVFYGISLLLFFPFLSIACLLWSLVGALLAVFQARDAPNAGLARWGIHSWWLITSIAGVLLIFLRPLALPSEWTMAIWIGVPLATAGLQRLARDFQGRSLPERIDVWLARHFVWRRSSGRTFDFRGEILALVGFLLAWACVSMKLLMPLQASALLSGVQLLNAISPGRMEFNVEESGSGASETNGFPRFNVRLGAPKMSSQVALLTWDGPTLHDATTTNSEAGIQAQLIRELSALGARRIVLPPPTLELATFNAQTDPHQAPPPKADDLARTKRDLSELVAAMRHATNVVLAAPSRNVLDFELTPAGAPAVVGKESFEMLESAAVQVGSTRLAPIQIAALPAVSLRWPSNELAPVSVLLAGALAGTTDFSPQPAGSRRISLLGRTYPVMDSTQGRLLLDFVTATRHRDFPVIPYSSVLRHEPIFDATVGKEGAWRSPSEFFRDKVIFLQPMRSRWLASPWGALDPMEIQAYGVRTLLGNFFVRAGSPPLQILWALVCALGLGHWAVRRNPIKAGVRLLLIALTAFGLSLILFSWGWWLDPVFPTVAAALAFLLVTQLTLSLERTAKERNRFLLDRFVAPEVVDELLAPADRRIGIGGRRERVAVLFADVRGFTQFAEGHAPEEVMKVVNAYLQVMTEVLHRYGGILDKYTGDGLMALFRLERMVSVADAIECALAMRDAVLALSADRTAGGDKSLQVGISLHVGEAVVGLVGNPERQVNFTALGHTVVVAARLQTLAGGGEVVVSQEVQVAAGKGFEMQPREAVLVKGISGPVIPFVVLRKRVDAEPNG